MDLNQLFREHHTALLLKLRCQCHGNQHLAEEIAAKVWLSLVRKPELVTMYDARRGSWLTYLSGIGHKLLLMHWRDERCRVRKLIELHRWGSAIRKLPDLSLQGLVETLSPAENAMYRHCLGELANQWSDTHRWQLRHRLMRKIRAFLQSEENHE